MKFKEYLNCVDFISTELIVNGYESRFSFEFDKDTKFTEKAQKIFKNLLNSDIKIKNNNIFIENVNVTEEETELFLRLLSGWINEKFYNECIINEEQ